VIIREAVLEDSLRIQEMATRFLLDSQYGSLFNDKTTPDAIAALIAGVMQIGTIFVAEVDHGGREVAPSRLVGMLAIVLVVHPLSGQKVAEEIAWWVEPEARGGSIGPKMLRVAEEWATRNSANMVKMVAPAGSTVGTFYEKSGYRAVETAFIKAI
jgi:GNAT superfamily N-acetyltransferase